MTCNQLIEISRKLAEEVGSLQFSPPVTHVYNPLEYASRCHNEYLRRFAVGPKRVVFLGMNPGPYGMSQTGVPFGEISWVRDWLGIQHKVGRPEREHPKRPILGFDCARSEVSGSRLWGTIAEHFETPDRFFESHYIANYCPLVFMEESGRNRTPDKLPATERDPLFEHCDAHLRRLVAVLRPEWVVGIGAFAQKRAQAALTADDSPKIATILHPSPANPRANANWAGEVRTQLGALGLCRRTNGNP
jgi:single-strand selective monofunctional uracil DNA glycosylase